MNEFSKDLLQLKHTDALTITSLRRIRVSPELMYYREWRERGGVPARQRVRAG